MNRVKSPSRRNRYGDGGRFFEANLRLPHWLCNAQRDGHRLDTPLPWL